MMASKSGALDSWLIKGVTPSTTEKELSQIENGNASSHSASLANCTEEREKSNGVTPDSESSGFPVQQLVPSAEFKFPRTGGRACQHAWFKTFKWLHYDSAGDFVLCHHCLKASHYKGIRSIDKAELTFLSKGFKNWKKGTEKFESHAKSSYHRQAVEFLLQKEKGTSVVDLIVTQSKEQQAEARAAMRLVLSSIRYLACTGQALRGLNNDEGNLRWLLQERCEDVPALKTWLAKRDNYLDGKIQNEVLEIMAHSVQRELVSDIKGSPFFGIISDGTTDVGGNEQLSLCIRWVDPCTLEVREDFMGMYQPLSAKADDLFNAINDMLVRLGLGTENLRGHCFDGAANMSGHLNGVQKKLVDVQPKSIFVHCSNHALDLALQEIGRRCQLMCDALGLVKDVSNIILESSKRRGIYCNVVLDTFDDDCTLNSSTSNLLPLCPTRWAVRVKALERFLENYHRVLETVKALLNDNAALRDDRRAALKGYQKQMKKVTLLFSLKAAVIIFGPCEQLAVALQKPGYTAAGAKSAADMLLGTLSQLRTDSAFERLWMETQKEANVLGLEMPQPSRERKIPRRLEQTTAPEPPAQMSLEVKLRKSFFEVLDKVEVEVGRRFSQPGMTTMMNLESVVLDAMKGKPPSSTELVEALAIHQSDFQIERLSAQLLLLPNIVKHTKSPSFSSLFHLLKSESPTVRELLDQVVRLVQLVMVVPASSASAERSFSALRRLKTYLRSKMTQKRLTHLLILHVHKQLTKQLVLDDVLKQFICVSSERKSTFGTL